MVASSFIGRVGGLAVALGIGAAAFNGSAAASADAPAAGSDNPSVGQARSTAPAGIATRNRSRSATKHSGVSAPARNGVSAQELSAPVPPRSATTPASGSLTAEGDPLTEPIANSNPAAPVDSPTEWTASSYPRRSVSVARSAAAVQAAAATQPVILGPSGVPIPSEYYVNTVTDWYVLPNSPGGVNPSQVVFTPEGLYPITGVKSLPLNTSVNQGLTILSDTLKTLPGGTTTTVFGYSQSAIIGSLLQENYIPPGSPYVPPKFPLPTIPTDLRDSINFVFVGNEMNPNGGFLSRFPNLTLPSLGINFYGGTPENLYPTTNYTREYDGFADFPRYPLNILADLNAGLGIVFVHPKYAPDLNCKTFCLTQQQVADAIALPTTSPTQKYYFMPTENLPLVEPLRLIPLIGNPIADLIQPVLKVIVNLGYGDPAHGFASATQPDANVVVPFGLFPDVSPAEVLSQLVAGVQQGVRDFVADFGSGGSIAREISSISLPNVSLSLPTADGIIGSIQNVITAIANRISFSVAGLYAALLPTADIVNALTISLAAYDVNLALDGLQQAISGDPIGGLINAIGLPIAASVGLVTTASLIGVLVWAQAAVAVLFPDYVIGT
jgi:hypothetical protein